MFVWVAVASVALALLRGGRVERLATFPFLHVWLVFAAFGVQLVMHLPMFTRLEPVRAAAPYLYPSAFCLLLVCFAFNRHAPGAAWLATGVLANLLVIVANGGKMPVDGQALAALGFPELRDAFAAGLSLTNTVIGPGTRLPWLGDIFVGSPPFPRPTIFSPGDVLLAVGAFVLVQRTMVAPRGERPEARAGEAA